MPAPPPPVRSRLRRFHAHEVRALVDTLSELQADLDASRLDPGRRAAAAEKAKSARMLAETGSFTEVSTVIDAVERSIATSDPGDLRDAVAHAIASLREIGGTAVGNRPALEATFLLVTTDDSLVDEVAPALAGSSYKLAIARDETAARALAQDANLVFLHARNPDVDALMVQRLRARTRLPPLAFVADEASMSARAAAARAGANLFLQRPLGVLGVLAAARQLLALADVAPARVLLLDADENRANALCAMLASRGLPTCRVDDVGMLEESLRLVDPDVLVINGAFADVSASELCRMIRSSADWSRLPVFVGLCEEEQAERLKVIEEGADDAAASWQPAELAARIRARTRHARMQREHASYDGMTGLLARGTFLDAAGAHLAEARRTWQPLAVGMLRIGEGGGPPATAQAALTRTAALLHIHFRAPHLIARWSARELALLVTGDVARNLAAELAAVRTHLEQDFHWRRLPEVSTAVASAPEDGITLPALLRLALARL